MNYYFHIPFCRSKCGYCAFYSEAGTLSRQGDRFLNQLAREVELAAENPDCETIYVGGGTPTLLTLPQLERLISLLSLLRQGREAECSIEANPETLDEEKVALLRRFFSRISVGVQSFSPLLRERVGRHCPQKSLERALSLVQEARFPHWNCDLIYHLPGESMAEWEFDLRMVSELGCDHVSCYSLTPEEHSRLGWSFTEDEDAEARMYERAGEFLADRGIFRYEISNYAAAGGECRHNRNVWRGGLLRGFGPSAAGFDGVDRWTQVSPLSRWLAGEAPERDIISREARLREIFAVNLRTVAGWTREMWAGVPGADAWENRLRAAKKAEKFCPGCLSIDERGIKLSPRGLLCWNAVAEELL